MTQTHQWMTYPPTGGAARVSVEAVEHWAARGWEQCEAPTEPDPTNTVLVDGVAPEPESDAASPEAQPPDDEVPPEQTEPATDATDDEE